MTVAPPSPREEHLAAARLHVSRSEFDQALPAFAAAEELGAFDEALQVERIKSYVKAERFDEALTLLQARAAWTEAAAYRMTTRVKHSAVGTKTYPTFTLPRYVDLG